MSDGDLVSLGVAGDIGDVESFRGSGGDSVQVSIGFEGSGDGAKSSVMIRGGDLLARFDLRFFFLEELEDGLRLRFFFFSRLCFFSLRR